jgi:hypothetical protein
LLVPPKQKRDLGRTFEINYSKFSFQKLKVKEKARAALFVARSCQIILGE